MQVKNNQRSTLLSWLFVATVAGLSVVLGVLQYRWIGEVSRAERERLRAGLQTNLRRLSQDFNTAVTEACLALLPESPWDANAGRAESYAQRYGHWKESGRHQGLFRRVALLKVEESAASLLILNPEKLAFEPGEWPPGWESIRDRVSGNSGEPRRFPGPFTEGTPAVLDLMRFSQPMPAPVPEREPDRERFGPPGPRRMEWLLVELDLDYVRGEILPELLQRHLAVGGRLDYDVEIVVRENPSVSIFRSQPSAGGVASRADGSSGMLEIRYDRVFRRFLPFRGNMAMGKGAPGRAFRSPDGVQPDRGRWEVFARHRAGSLDLLVAQTRRRNLAVISGIMLLMLAAVGALVRFTQRAQRLARLEMEFVAGVSHELRTPLSVIRTAAHNLGGGVVSSPQQVQRYGGLIEDEAERLTRIVEQVLRFASAKAGRPIGAREPVAVGELVAQALAATERILEESGCKVESQVEEGLPPVLADPVSMGHALQNLLANAAKYGAQGGWIGISAGAGEGVVEIRVADRGAGIPADEVGQVFDPFYRGKRAVEDQIHGTGLGLSLVKRIVEAHQGTVTVESAPGEITEFLVRIPAAAVEQADEFADTSRRG